MKIYKNEATLMDMDESKYIMENESDRNETNDCS